MKLLTSVFEQDNSTNLHSRVEIHVEDIDIDIVMCIDNDRTRHRSFCLPKQVWGDAECPRRVVVDVDVVSGCEIHAGIS